MIINKIVQSLAKNFSAPSEIRPTLASVFFTKNKAVATDSYKLCEIEFLNINSNKSFLINKNDLLNLKIDHKLNILTTKDWIEFKNDNQTIKTNKHKGDFIDYENYFNNDNILNIWCDVDMLIKVLQIYQKAKVKRVKMTLWTSLQPLLFEALYSEYELKANDIKQIRSLLMPIKI